MAKKPKTETVGEAETPLPTDDGRVALRILKDGVHDGLGGVWRQGEIAHLPKDVADIFISKECAVPADDASIIEAKKRGAEQLAKAEAASNKAGAVSRQRSYDDAPKSIRDLAKEFGDEIVGRWEMGDSEDNILKDYT